MSKLYLWLCVCWIVYFMMSANAFGADVKASVKLKQELALGNQNADKLFTAIRPKLSIKLDSAWQAELDLQLEKSAADLGLGTRASYSKLSRPIVIGNNAHLEIKSATLRWRKRTSRLVIGKQSFAWGILDGLQVTDRFDATQKREAVFSEQRPVRISRWGLRAQFTYGKTRIDSGILFDSTADQLATVGSTYEATASRYRGGFSSEQNIPDVTFKRSSTSTIGIKGARRFGNKDVSLLLIHGPDTEPVISLSNTNIELRYYTRTLLGMTYQQPLGDNIWRFEIASIFNQALNLSGTALFIKRRQRYLAGLGTDWNISNNLFMNAQLGIDHVEGSNLVRPSTDMIATVKLIHSSYNDAFLLNAELLASVNSKDGAFRPSFTWHQSDSLKIKGGVDVVWGDRNTQFGQFATRDRIWLSFGWSL